MFPSEVKQEIIEKHEPSVNMSDLVERHAGTYLRSPKL